MRIETIYYADDGAEFYDEEECRAYEESIKQAFDGVIFFDGCLNKLPPDIARIEGEAFYMYILDEKKAVSLFNWLQEQISFEVPQIEVEVADYLCWDEEKDEWYNMEHEARSLYDRMSKMRNQIFRGDT